MLSSSSAEESHESPPEWLKERTLGLGVHRGWGMAGSFQERILLSGFFSGLNFLSLFLRGSSLLGESFL